MAARDLAAVHTHNLVKQGGSGYSSEGQESAVKLQPRRLFWRLGESSLRADGSLYISCRACATKLSLQPGPGGFKSLDAEVHCERGERSRDFQTQQD